MLGALLLIVVGVWSTCGTTTPMFASSSRQQTPSPTGIAESPESLCPQGSDPSPLVVFCEDYESGQVGAWPGYIGSWSTTTTAPYAGTYALDIHYGALPADGDGAGGGGYGFMPNVPALDEFHLRFYEKFSPDWRWSPIATKGWQLKPEGPGWDIYLMNDEWGSGERNTVLQDTPFRSYTVLDSNIASFNWNRNLGSWNLVEVHVRLNTPGQRDGIFRQWVNGRLTSRHTDVWYRQDAQGVSGFMLSAYWNCSSNDCSRHSRSEQHRYIDNIVLARGDTMIGEVTLP